MRVRHNHCTDERAGDAGVQCVQVDARRRTQRLSNVAAAHTPILPRQLASHTRLKCAAIIGGMAMQKQERLLSRCPHVVVATPGELQPAS